LVAFGEGWSKEATIVRHVWAAEPALVRWDLDVVDRACRVCGRKMHVCDHRRHPIYTLQGPRLLVNRLVHCVDTACAGHHRTVSPEAEASIALPRSILGWDLFCWIGHRRFARHWSVPQIRAELLDSRQISLSDDAIEDALRHYQWMLAAREQDPRVLAEEYAAAGRLFFDSGNPPYQELIGRTPIEPRSWNHVVLVRAGDQVRVHLNGRPEPEFVGRATVDPRLAGTEWYFGGRSDNFANLEGKLAEAAIYDRALSAEEVARHYEAAGMPPSGE
jgi:hypothetical protein